MNITGFLQCLNSNNFQSGNLVAYYDFSQKNSQVVYNLKYSTGYNYSGGYINLDACPGVFVGSKTSVGNQVSTKVGSFLNLANLHSLFNFDFSGCQNTGLVESTILLTSKTGASDVSGFNLGINSSNRLFFENNNQIYTLNKELKNKNIVNFSVSQNTFVNFGLFDFESNAYVGLNIESPLLKSTTNLYLINYPTGSDIYYSGLMGSLSNFAILNDTITQREALSKCLFCTGINYSTGYVSGAIISITGVNLQNTYESGVTGYQTVYLPITQENGSVVTGVYLSGVSGSILVDSQFVPMVQSGAYASSAYQTSAIKYNSQEILGYISYNLLFNPNQYPYALYSGDNVEILTYNDYQPYKNIAINDYALPSVTGLNLNLYINGLLETQGVDYQILGNKITIIGNQSASNIIIANYSINPTQTVDYLSTGQFPINGSNQVCITGSGFNSGYDAYLNGQKLIQNISYYTGTYSSQPAIIFYSGVLYTGSELKFYPIDDVPIYTLKQITSSSSEVSGISGFSDQVWVNGVLQSKPQDYILSQPCFKDSYYYLSSISDFLIYNNDDYYLNN